MTVVKFRKNPIEFEAIQWTGHNLEALQAFVGNRPGYEDEQVPAFTPLGTYIPEFLHPAGTGELWVDANQRVLPVDVGEWVIKDDLGYYPCKDHILKKNNTPIGLAGSYV